MAAACFICPSPSTQTCPRCHAVSFCSDHSKYHSNSEQCFPFRVSYKEGVGRFLLAARDIEAGEVLFQEEALVQGPGRRSRPVCLGCLCTVDCTVRCGGCGWPVCGKECAKIANHRGEECSAIAGEGEAIGMEEEEEKNQQMYRAILTLRVLLLKKVDLLYFMQFMGHLEERDVGGQGAEVWVAKWGRGRWTEEQIRKVEAILDVNTYMLEHSLEENPSMRSFLPITSLASHSCVSNTTKFVEPSHTTSGHVTTSQVTTRAKVPIRKGQELTLHYQGGLKGRGWRQKGLKKSWYFVCNCERCRSPDELGAEMSTMRCWKHLCAGDVRPVAATCSDSPYKCDSCSEEYSSAEVVGCEEHLAKMLGQIYKTDTRAMMDTLKLTETAFHPRNWLVLSVKSHLINTWGRTEGHKYHQVTEEEINYKIEFCKDFLKALEVADPGISSTRGLVLWELHTAEAFLINKKMKEQRIAPVKFVEGLEETLKIVSEVDRCLQYDTPHSLEGRTRTLSNLARTKIEETLKVLTKTTSAGIN